MSEFKMYSEEGCEDGLSKPEARRVFYSVWIKSGSYVDVMIAEDANTAYIMQNTDGTTVCGDKFELPYNEQEVIQMAVSAFENEFHRKPNFIK